MTASRGTIIARPVYELMLVRGGADAASFPPPYNTPPRLFHGTGSTCDPSSVRPLILKHHRRRAPSRLYMRDSDSDSIWIESDSTCRIARQILQASVSVTVAASKASAAPRSRCCRFRSLMTPNPSRSDDSFCCRASLRKSSRRDTENLQDLDAQRGNAGHRRVFVRLDANEGVHPPPQLRHGSQPRSHRRRILVRFDPPSDPNDVVPRSPQCVVFQDVYCVRFLLEDRGLMHHF
ncbi:hypothetical protein B0H15DRAFT_859037 [Mycena belliarum]|uniref:Uncharacterized protein n=1 Tax=Mycena belliarum TaxID=1033014 RepID=A0AAD6TYV4_9AGAR|nr:hypothetical protein B0H15DRAFT_859037 [Mycena belliae]